MWWGRCLARKNFQSPPNSAKINNAGQYPSQRVFLKIREMVFTKQMIQGLASHVRYSVNQLVILRITSSSDLLNFKYTALPY